MGNAAYQIVIGLIVFILGCSVGYLIKDYKDMKKDG